LLNFLLLPPDIMHLIFYFYGNPPLLI